MARRWTLDLFTTELSFFSAELAFFTTEHTENGLRTTEEYNGNFLGELQMPRKSLRGALLLPLVVAVLSVALKFFLRDLRGKEGQLCGEEVQRGAAAFFTTEHTENGLRTTEEYNGNFLGELQMPRKSLRGALLLPLVVAVLRGPLFSSVTSVVKKVSSAEKKSSVAPQPFSPRSARRTA